VRVKVYGLFPLTRRRYLWQAAFGGLGLSLLFAVWLAAWPQIAERLPHVRLDPWAAAVVAVVAQTPWILLALALFKAVEMWFVLRLFAVREAEQRKAAPPPA
jgi:hypothetical protein